MSGKAELLDRITVRADVFNGKPIIVREAAARPGKVDALGAKTEPAGVDVGPERAGWRNGAEPDAGDAGWSRTAAGVDGGREVNR